MISPGVFFQFLKILIFFVVRGVKVQNMVQNDKKFHLSHFISQEPYIIQLSFMVHLCEMMSSGVFFQFFKILIFQVNRVKEQKAVQIDKKFCPSCSISPELYIIWLSFIVHLCKMVISPGVFFSFSKFWFFRLVKGVKGQKTVQNDKKILSVTLHISGNIHHMIVIYGTLV